MKKGILFIGHGSRLNHNREAIEAQANALKERTGIPVWTAYNETTAPLVDAVAEEMVGSGIEEIIAIPFFIASGLHITRDIPRKLNIPEGSSGGKTIIAGKKVTVHLEQPFGDDPNLTDILEERISDLCREKECSIVVIGHGSRLQYNREVVKANAERLTERGYENVYYGFNEFNDPSIEAAMSVAVGSGAQDIAVLPLFIASGAHLAEEIPEKLGIPMNSYGGVSDLYGREVNIYYAMPVGDDPRLVEVLVKKLEKYGI
ncbi:MAG: CbiX/SirB N-terminal domain-containing protein [Methanomassiliicoccaceae archaeon]|nr:CbiX/SirB N-terminal domain-containing protein [Methanomassiliicoccaceae archaeon]